MTQKSTRRRLVPRAAIIASVVIIVLIGAAVAASLMVARSRLIDTPGVQGMPEKAARETLEAEGLVYQLGATRVSADIAAGQVIAQDPKPGTLVEPGTVVSVVLSVGPQTFTVPDLVGSSLDGARDALAAMGLKVTVVSVSSESTGTIVLEMYPAPGASVSPGDEIRISIPGGSDEADVLLPYDLTGKTVLLDPLPPATGTEGDPAMEVTRRLQALFEAAGAKVTSTRPASGMPTAADRSTAAAASGADVFVGIDVVKGGQGGLRVLFLEAGQDVRREAASKDYAQVITRAASLPTLVVREPAASQDAVMAATPAPGVRVEIGDSTVASDRALFGDPNWADQVARAIYRGIGPTLSGT